MLRPAGYLDKGGSVPRSCSGCASGATAPELAALLASASFVDFVIVDDGASVHDAHLDAAPSDYDSEFATLQLQSGGSMASAEGRTKQMKI